MSTPLVLAAAEYARRRNDGLETFRPMESQMPMFTSGASELLCRGGNRSGKSTAAAVRFASIARDKPVHGLNGESLDQVPVWQKNRPLILWCVGLVWDHVGSTLFRLLFKRGLYKIIRDTRTGAWRTFDPIKDAGRERHTRPSFPLIPMSAVKGGVKGIAWEDKKEKQFSSFELTNGNVVQAWASTGEVKQGDPVDYIWIDERIAIPSHYAEWQARLSDTKGRILWSSMPREDNGAMMRVSRMAQSQAEEVQRGLREKADVEEVVLPFSENPFIDEDEKRKRLEGWSEDERRRRDAGEFVTDTIRVYPTFDKLIHRAIYGDLAEDDLVSKTLRETGGVPPSDWTHELILDPGTQKPAVLFGAIPPPTMWDDREPYYVIYDEIYEPRLDARMLARRVRQKKDMLRLPTFERFIIDGHAARQTPMGFSGTVGQNYSDEFRRAKLFCRQTEYSFIPGDPDFMSRSAVVSRWMSHRPCGRPQLRVVIDRCPSLLWQLQFNVRKTRTDPEGFTIVLEKAEDGQRDDLRVAIEYWASRKPTWVESDLSMERAGPMMSQVQAIERMFPDDEGKKTGDDTIFCGPGTAAVA